jgi:hypothetical protein
LDTVFRSPQMRNPYFRIVAIIRQFEMPRQGESAAFYAVAVCATDCSPRASISNSLILYF